MTFVEQANEPMRRYLHRAHEIASTDQLNPDLTKTKTIDDGLVLHNGAVILSAGLTGNMHLFDRANLTGSEAALNELRLDKYFNGEAWISRCVWGKAS